MEQPKVSIIVPVYKVEKYLVQCIESILAQTLKDIEIILIDEGDMDGCRIIIDHYAKIDDRIIAIHEKSGGYGASVNKGFCIAKGEYIGIVESDDFIDPYMYEEMYNYAKKLDSDIVKTPYFEYWDRTKNSPEIKRDCFWYNRVLDVPQNKNFKITEYPQMVGLHPSIWSCIYKKDFIISKNIFFIDTIKAQYVDNPFRVLSMINSNKISYLRKSFYYYRLSNPDASVANFNIDEMILRWNEIHEILNNNYDIYLNILPYLIQEEYVCTYEKILHLGFVCNSKSYDILKENIKDLNIDAIYKSPLLTSYQKEELINIKKSYKVLFCGIKSKLIWHRCFTKFKRNNIYIHLFKYFPIPIFSIRFSIFRLNTSFIIGKKVF